MSETLLTERFKLSTQRLLELRTRIDETTSPKMHNDICVYVTGSYGRLEASQHSDLDLFLIHKQDNDHEICNTDKFEILGDLIRICRELGFPEFSGDGEFLDVQEFKNIIGFLGSKEDDYNNCFTARLLLLLESRPIFNDEFYNDVLYEVVDSYYRDYHDHESDFRPIFIVNDIIRFWKTLCLNYEHKRNRRTEDKKKKGKIHVKNLKLKFSRLLTCYSMVLFLIKNRDIVKPEELVKFITIPPLERLKSLSSEGIRNGKILEGIVTDYCWFLDMTGRNEKEVIKWIMNKDERDRAFNHAREFRNKMYKLLVGVSRDSDLFQYLVI